MAFDEVRFPTGISYGSEGGPEFSTEVIELGNGYERRNQHWTLPRERWNVAYGVKTKADLDVLVSFFIARCGRVRGFRFKNHDDFTITQEQMWWVNATTYRIVKHYGSVVRFIHKPVTGTVHVLHDNGTAYPPGDWAVDVTTGIVTFTSAPAEVPRVTCQFDVPMRFDADYLSRRFEDYEARSASVPLLEVRL
jgi:uncharacterized protein (TIGR02217 family)